LEEKEIWKGKPTVLAFIDMLSGGALLMIVSGVAAMLMHLGVIRLISLVGLIGGAVVIASALLVSQAYTYIVTNKKLRKEYRFIAFTAEEVPLQEVTNVIVAQNIIGRLLGFGTIKADTAGTSYAGIVFRGVKNPDQVFKALTGAKSEVDEILESP